MYSYKCDCSICLDETKMSPLRLQAYINQNRSVCIDERLFLYLTYLVQYQLMQLPYKLKCGHLFHLKCIQRVFVLKSESVKCPNCRLISKYTDSETRNIWLDLIEFIDLRSRLYKMINSIKVKKQCLFPLSRLSTSLTDQHWEIAIQFQRIKERMIEIASYCQNLPQDDRVELPFYKANLYEYLQQEYYITEEGHWITL